MSMIPQFNENEHQLNVTIDNFFSRFKISDILHRCRAVKEKGVPVLDVFRFLFFSIFSHRSMYMQIQTGSFRESFSKNTVYRFLNLLKTNRLRFTTSLLEKIINGFMRGLTSEDRRDAFVINDSLQSSQTDFTASSPNMRSTLGVSAAA